MAFETEIIGGCTLYRGDCLEVMASLSEGSVDCIVSDPPYGNTSLTSAKGAYDDVAPDLPVVWEHLRRIRKPTTIAAIFASGRDFPTDVILSNRKEYRYPLMWVKAESEDAKPTITGFLDARKRPLRAFESVLIFTGQFKDSTYNPQMTKGTPYARHVKKMRSIRMYNKTYGDVVHKSDGDRFPNDVLYFQVDTRRSGLESDHDDEIHSSSKPVPLLEWLVKSYSNEGEMVLDMFAGGGSTGVAAILAGRRCILIEKEKKWFDVSCKRVAEAVETTQNGGIPLIDDRAKHKPKFGFVTTRLP